MINSDFEKPQKEGNMFYYYYAKRNKARINEKKLHHLSNFPNFFANQIERSWERQKYLTVSINISCKLFSHSLFVYNRLP